MPLILPLSPSLKSDALRYPPYSVPHPPCLCASPLVSDTIYLPPLTYLPLIDAHGLHPPSTLDTISYFTHPPFRRVFSSAYCDMGCTNQGNNTPYYVPPLCTPTMPRPALSPSCLSIISLCNRDLTLSYIFSHALTLSSPIPTSSCISG